MQGGFRTWRVKTWSVELGGMVGGDFFYSVIRNSPTNYLSLLVSKLPCLGRGGLFFCTPPNPEPSPRDHMVAWLEKRLARLGPRDVAQPPFSPPLDLLGTIRYIFFSSLPPSSTLVVHLRFGKELVESPNAVFSILVDRYGIGNWASTLKIDFFPGRACDKRTRRMRVKFASGPKTEHATTLVFPTCYRRGG
jgi:hypothetical protein